MNTDATSIPVAFSKPSKAGQRLASRIIGFLSTIARSMPANSKPRVLAAFSQIESRFRESVADCPTEPMAML